MLIQVSARLKWHLIMVLAANMCLRGEDFASFSTVPAVDGLRALAAASVLEYGAPL